MTGAIGGELNGFGGLNPVNDFKKIYNNNLKEINEFNEQGENTADLKGYISKTDIANDPELAGDLKVLTDGISVDGVNSNKMSADKVAKTFKSVLGDHFSEVNSLSQASDKAIETFASGGKIDLHTVMIASEKAGLAMQLTMQMRNKILQAYQEISRMQV